jgi:hypothetical protein
MENVFGLVGGGPAMDVPWGAISVGRLNEGLLSQVFFCPDSFAMAISSLSLNRNISLSGVPS